MAAAAQRRSEQSLNAVRGNVLSQRSVADLQRMTAEAEQQLSARDGFEFEDGHRGSGNWRPILDQNAVHIADASVSAVYTRHEQTCRLYVYWHNALRPEDCSAAAMAENADSNDL